MKIFGKTVGEYFGFQKVLMIAIIVVGAARLGLSLAGVSFSVVKWLSITAIAVIGIIYVGIQVPRTGFGGYKQLLPLYFMQAVTGNFFIVLGIVIAIQTGKENIFSRPEYSGPMANNQWFHALAHAIDGLIVGPLLGWLLGSGVMFITKKLSAEKRTPTPAGV